MQRFQAAIHLHPDHPQLSTLTESSNALVLWLLFQVFIDENVKNVQKSL